MKKTRILFIMIMLIAFSTQLVNADVNVTIPHFTEDFFIGSNSDDSNGTYKHVHKFGISPYIDTVGYKLIWTLSENYNFLSTAQQLNVSSDNLNDVIGGTGAWNITLQGLDGSFNEVEEIIQLNGLTNVTTVNSYLRVHRAFVMEGGNRQGNLGNILVSNQQWNLLHIFPQKSQTLMCVYTVPSGYTAYLVGLTMHTSEDKPVYVSMWARDNGLGENAVFRVRTEASIWRQEFNIPYPIQTKFGEKTDIVLGAYSTQGTATVSGTYDLVLIKNSHTTGDFYTVTGNVGIDANMIEVILLFILVMVTIGKEVLKK